MHHPAISAVKIWRPQEDARRLPRLRPNPIRDPLDETRLFVPSGDLQRRETVVVSGREVSSVLDEERKCFRAGGPFGSEMGRGSAALSAGVDVRAVRDQPGDRPMIPLMGERLQRRAVAAALAVNRYAAVQERLGDVVCPSAVALKVAKRN